MPQPDANRPLRLLLVLGGIAALSALSLGSVAVLTAEPIAQGRAARQSAALSAVLPGFDNDPAAEALDQGALRVFPARVQGVLRGWAVHSVSRNGFSGPVELMVGFESDGRLRAVRVLRQSETPGLGTKMTDPAWLAQFEGLAPSRFPLAVRKDGGEVDALTAATISSRAVVEALNAAQGGRP